MTRADAEIAIRRLTPRQREVFDLMLGGFGATAIAQKLWITRDTAKWHQKAIFAALKSRTALGVVAIFVDPPVPAHVDTSR